MAKTLPFKSAFSAWFWFMENRSAPPSDTGLVQPIDILKALDRLYAADILKDEHVLVLKKYGGRGRSPDPRLSEERTAHKLWREAMGRLDVEFRHIGIVKGENKNG